MHFLINQINIRFYTLWALLYVIYYMYIAINNINFIIKICRHIAAYRKERNCVHIIFKRKRKKWKREIIWRKTNLPFSTIGFKQFCVFNIGLIQIYVQQVCAIKFKYLIKSLPTIFSNWRERKYSSNKLGPNQGFVLNRLGASRRPKDPGRFYVHTSFPFWLRTWYDLLNLSLKV